MPRIKDALAAGEIVRLFGVGQLCSPKLVEIVAGAQGIRLRLWIDAEHGGLGTRISSLQHQWPHARTAWTTSSACRPLITPRS